MAGPIRKLSDAAGKPLSELYVVLDQSEDRINNGYFAVDMNGYNPRNPNATRWWIIQPITTTTPEG